MPPAPNPRDRWTAEFKELGADRVRSTLLGNQWDRDKRAVARMWIETQDALAWQHKNQGREPGQSGSFIVRLRAAKWWRYVGPAIGIFMGLGLLIRRMKAF